MTELRFLPNQASGRKWKAFVFPIVVLLYLYRIINGPNNGLFNLWIIIVRLSKYEMSLLMVYQSQPMLETLIKSLLPITLASDITYKTLQTFQWSSKLSFPEGEIPSGIKMFRFTDVIWWLLVLYLCTRPSSGHKNYKTLQTNQINLD